MRKQIVADLSILMVVIVWGYTFVAIKNALETITPFNFIFVRFIISFFLISLIFFRKFRSLKMETVKSGVVVGVFLFLAYAFQTAGLKYTTASNAGFITGFSVVLVPVFSSLLLKKKPSAESTVGVIMAATGLFLLSYGGVSSVNRGDILVFFCALSVAAHILSVGYYVKTNDSVQLTIVQIGTVAFLAFLSDLFAGEISMPAGETVWSAILICAVFATVGAYLVQNIMQRFTSPTHTALIFSGEPVFAGLFGYFLLGENLGAMALAGCFFILTGMVVSEVKLTGEVDEL